MAQEVRFIKSVSSNIVASCFSHRAYAPMSTFVSLAVSLVLSGAESAVNDDRFKRVPSKSAATVLTVGKSLVEWLSGNHEDAKVFCSPLVSAIHGCIPSKLTSVQSRECLWKQYHQLHNSSTTQKHNIVIPLCKTTVINYSNQHKSHE